MRIALVPEWIYALVDPRDDTVQYVGRTVDPSARLSMHVSRPHSRRLRSWAGSLARDGQRPRLRLLWHVGVGEDVADMESTWLATLKPPLNAIRVDTAAALTARREAYRRSTAAWHQARERAARERGEERLVLRLPPETIATIRKRAEAAGLTVSGYVERLVGGRKACVVP